MGWSASARWVRVRLFIAASVLGLFFVLLASRAWVLQVREARKLREMAEDQYLKEIELPSRRGRILDRNGAELAASVEVDSIYANPRQIEASGTVDDTARELARVLKLERRDLQHALSTHRYFTWVKRRVLPEEARAVKELGLVGVSIAKEPRRYYPNRGLGGPVIGWAGLDGKGLEGIELRWDRELRGAPAEVQGLRDALGREVLSSGLGDAAPQGGRDLVTTVDKFIQYRLEHALEEGVLKNRARAGVAVALDPRSGEVLAMAAVPGLNPNEPGAHAGARNRAVTDPFEPGSTMKTFSIASAVEAGVVGPDDPWFCENGRFQIGPAVIHDAEKIGDVTTTGVLARSSNICTAKIARRAGRERVDAMLRRFHFAAPTGIDLPGERAGLLRPAARWGEVELATISFGQGVTATPLQIASAYAALANGGTWYRPHVVRRVLDEKGQPVSEAVPHGERVVDEKLAATMRKMLFAVTQKNGTAEKLAIPGYPAAGKTGTAQKVDPATRRYSTEKWASSFVGFAPLDDPRLVIFVMVDEPAGSHYGGAVAGPIWRDVMLDALRYLGVPPRAEELVAMQDKNNATQKENAATQQSSGAEPAVPVFDADSSPNTPRDEEPSGVGDDASDETLAGDPAREVPDFAGLPLGEALELARRARWPVQLSGSGRVVGQRPGPGPARGGGPVQLQLEPPG